MQEYKPMVKDRGALNGADCPAGGGNRCGKDCGPPCAHCGYRPHTAIHCTVIGGGERPYGHMYEGQLPVPKKQQAAALAKHRERP